MTKEVDEIQEMRKVALPKLLPQIYQSHSWERPDNKEWNLKFVQSKIGNARNKQSGFLFYTTGK